jgi:hypothetical protein
MYILTGERLGQATVGSKDYEEMRKDYEEMQRRFNAAKEEHEIKQRFYAAKDEHEKRLASLPSIVRIILIDPTRILKNRNGLLKTVCQKLEKKFNHLDPHWLKRMRFDFRVQYSSNELTSEEKARLGKLDFPVYLLGKQHSHTDILKRMEQHKIPKTINGTDLYDLAEKGWKDKDLRGVGIPSGKKGYRKVAFIKTDRVFNDATGDYWQAFVNVIAHEIGHMGNLMLHGKKGLMKYPIRLDIDIDFDTGDKYKFLENLRALRKL